MSIEQDFAETVPPRVPFVAVRPQFVWAWYLALAIALLFRL